MPVDARHGRRIPSGRRLARVLASVFAAMRGDTVAAVMQRRLPDLGKYRAAIVRAVLPVLLHEYALGHEAARRDHRRRAKGVHSLWTPCGHLVDRVRVKALRYDDAAPGGGGHAAALPGVSFDLLREGVPQAVQRLVLALAGTITDTLRQDVRDAVESGLSAGEPLATVANRVGEFFEPRRAYTIAASEASRAMHSAEEEAAREAGAAGLQWLASSDACDECSALDGKRAKMGEPFVVLTTGRAEYRTVYHPPRHPRCGCAVTPYWSEDE